MFRTMLAAVLLVLVASSCARLPKAPDPGEGDLDRIIMQDRDSIPADWGDMIGVSSVPEYKTWVQLWFQDEEGNVRMVPYAIDSNRFYDTFTLFPRK